jgi:hypothetical protein
MKNNTAQAPTVAELLKDHSPQVRQIVQELRDLLRQAAPEAIESAHGVWHSIHYHDPHNGYFCGIFPQEETVLLVFEFGILLPDPEHVLEGTGKQVRSIRIRTGEELPAAAIRGLIRAALALPGSRKDKLAMIRSGARVVKGEQ